MEAQPAENNNNVDPTRRTYKLDPYGQSNVENLIIANPVAAKSIPLQGVYEVPTNGLIDRGGQGRVYKLVQLFGNKVYALKAVSFSANGRSPVKEEFHLLNLVGASHRFVKTFAYFEVDEVGFMVMELCEKSLKDMIIFGKLFDYQQALDLVRSLVEGLQALDAAGYAHHNLKPCNVVWDGTGWKIIGLSASSKLDALSSAGSKTNISPEAFAKRAFDMLQADRKSWSHKTLVRMDPDPNNDPSSQIEHFIMQAQEHGGAAVDVWGLALILYCAVTGTDTPFPRLKDFPSPEASSEVFYDFALDFTLDVKNFQLHMAQDPRFVASEHVPELVLDKHDGSLDWLASLLKGGLCLSGANLPSRMHGLAIIYHAPRMKKDLAGLAVCHFAKLVVQVKVEEPLVEAEAYPAHQRTDSAGISSLLPLPTLVIEDADPFSDDHASPQATALVDDEALPSTFAPSFGTIARAPTGIENHSFIGSSSISAASNGKEFAISEDEKDAVLSSSTSPFLTNPSFVPTYAPHRRWIPSALSLVLARPLSLSRRDDIEAVAARESQGASNHSERSTIESPQSTRSFGIGPSQIGNFHHLPISQSAAPTSSLLLAHPSTSATSNRASSLAPTPPLPPHPTPRLSSTTGAKQIARPTASVVNAYTMEAFANLQATYPGKYKARATQVRHESGEGEGVVPEEWHCLLCTAKNDGSLMSEHACRRHLMDFHAEILTEGGVLLTLGLKIVDSIASRRPKRTGTAARV